MISIDVSRASACRRSAAELTGPISVAAESSPTSRVPSGGSQATALELASWRSAASASAAGRQGAGTVTTESPSAALSSASATKLEAEG